MRIKSIRDKKTESFKNLKVQAIKMKQAFKNRFRLGEVDQSVTIKTLDNDRARSDFKYVIRVILLGTYKYFTN